MKLNKIFAICLAALTVTACSDDDDKHDLNTAEGVTVHMEESVIEVMENNGLFDVPVVVDGNANGYVEVTVKVSDGTTMNEEEEPAINDAHFYVTSTHLYINNETKVGNIEIRPVDFRLPQKTRSFTVSIESVKGATVSGNATTTVKILDKGTSPAFAQLLQGEWIISYMSTNDETGELDTPLADRGKATVTDAQKMEFVISPFTGNGFQLPLVYEYDDEIGYGDIAIRLGEVIGGPFNFTGLGPCYIIMRDNDTNSDTGTVTGQWNSKYNAVKFGTKVFAAGVYTVDGLKYQGYYDLFTNMVLTHITQ